MNNFFFARIQGISAQKRNSLHLDRMYSYHFDGLVSSSSSSLVLHS
jgi:hypothetical protein